MISIVDRTVDIDVTPANHKDVQLTERGDAAIARAVTTWIHDHPAPRVGKVHMGHVAAITISVPTPHVVLRVVVCDGATDADVEAFRAAIADTLGGALAPLCRRPAA